MNQLDFFSDLECVLTFCDNPTDEPNTNGANYNFTWDGDRIPVNTFITYPCQDDMAVENNTVWKNLSSTESQVYCDPSDGELRYPSPWPQCSETRHCGPAPAAEVNGSRQWLHGARSGDDRYDIRIRYRWTQDCVIETLIIVIQVYCRIQVWHWWEWCWWCWSCGHLV